MLKAKLKVTNLTSDPIDDMLELPAEFGENRFSLGIMERGKS